MLHLHTFEEFEKGGFSPPLREKSSAFTSNSMTFHVKPRGIPISSARSPSMHNTRCRGLGWLSNPALELQSRISRLPAFYLTHSFRAQQNHHAWRPQRLGCRRHASCVPEFHAWIHGASERNNTVPKYTPVLSRPPREPRKASGVLRICPPYKRQIIVSRQISVNALDDKWQTLSCTPPIVRRRI